MFARCHTCRRLLLVGESPADRWERMSAAARAFLWRLGCAPLAPRIFTCTECVRAAAAGNEEQA